MSISLLEIVKKLPLPDLNIKYTISNNDEEGEVDESYYIASMSNVPIKNLLQNKS
jgi:hypothetical protein